MAPKAYDFRQALFSRLGEAQEDGARYLDITAGELHRTVGGYPGNHRMPNCCQVMRSTMHPGDSILAEPRKGAGASLAIRFLLPRT